MNASADEDEDRLADNTLPTELMQIIEALAEAQARRDYNAYQPNPEMRAP